MPSPLMLSLVCATLMSGLALALALVPQPVQAQAQAQAAGKPVTVPLAVIGLSDDPRYANRRRERAYPGHPAGRAIDGVKLGAEDSAFELEAAGVEMPVRELLINDAAGLPKALAELKAARVQHIVADLPEPLLRQLVQAAPAALGGALVINAGLDHDGLRGAQCAPHLLHTYPSRAMLSDALAQYLAARNWRKVLLLTGPEPADALQTEAFQRSARRYGLKVTQQKPFKLTGDPRDRDLANTRLLTGEREHEVVAVMDANGEFARLLPYATQWPRPVVGANGLTVQPWHPQWERNGGPQLTRRFARQENRPMLGHDWAAWAAAKAVAAALVDAPRAPVAQHIQRLRTGQSYIDGFKGPRLSFRAWDGQLRQPLFVAHGDGVAGVAPLDGVLHPKEVLDTLGVDEAETACKAR